MADLPAYENIQFNLVSIENNPNKTLADCWKEVQTVSNGLLTDWGIEKLREGLDPFVKTILVETPYICEDFRSLHRHFYGRKFRERPSKCARLHFFNEPVSASDLLEDTTNEFYMGFSVIEPLVVRCIGRTVIDPQKLGHSPDSVHLLGTRFVTRIGGKRYECHGFPYRTQSNEATVCAHVTMWAVCRYLSQRFQLYRKHLPYELIEMAGRRNGRVVPHHALSYADYSEMLDRFGCHPIIVANHGFGTTPFSSPNTKISCQAQHALFLKSLYCYIESGFPLIATFGGHVVSIVGHKSLEPDCIVERTKIADPKNPSSTLIHASEFVDEYIMMDDNSFPYQILPRVADTEAPNNTRTLEHLRGIVVPLADEVFLRPRDVDGYVVKFLNEPMFKQIVDTFMLKEAKDEPLVYRPFLTTGVSYKQFKQQQLKLFPDDGAIGLQLLLSLPRFIWCVELSTPNLRAEDRAFGEILLDATAGESDLEPIFVRIGPELARSPMDNGKYQLDYFEQNPYSKFAQYRHNLGTPNS